MIWYIAGPMTGIEDWNYPAFHEAERWLREHFPGDEIINPATCFDGNTTLPREHYMRAALVNVAKCDRVYLLDGWRQSRGACLEVLAATVCGAEIWHVGDAEACPDQLVRAADYYAAAHSLDRR